MRTKSKKTTVKKIKIISGTRDAVENSIELSKNEKGTWEGVTRKKENRVPKWETMTREDFMDVLKKVSRPIEKEEKAETER